VRLTERYALVGAVSGRRTADVRALIGLDTIAYAGNHGLELLMPGETDPSPDPSIDGRERDAADFIAGLEPERLGLPGLRLEDKGPIQAIHWRGAEDVATIEAAMRSVAVDAGRAGLDPHWGRKILELRPVGGGGKDAAVASLLAGDGLDRVVYAGDDRTDVDAFRRLGELREAGELVAAVRVGVLSAEGPAEIAEESDFTVDGPVGWLEILDWLAE
ncbi:MAG TPA: trehalose-phosphatase, partial [Solirubrobacterales bacterium]